MRIAIDAHMVGGRESGNETYTLNLIKALGELSEENRYYLYTPRPDVLGARLHTPSQNLSITRVGPPNPFLRIPISMPLACRRLGAQLLHVNYIAPPLCPCPTVITIHDISFEFFPHFFSPRDYLVLSRLVPYSARRAAKVITVSENSKRDIVRCYRIPKERIAVTYEGADDSFRPLQDEERLEAVKRKYEIVGSFILTLGNLEPRKNLGRLVEAYGALRKGGRIEHKLVIVGRARWRESELHSVVRGRGLVGEVIFTGYIPQEDLPLLYNAADLFLFPSLYEGFGLPPLEAMACGTPVIASNSSSLPEVVGDGGLLVDPHDTSAIAQAIDDLLTKPALRLELSARGLKRAALFSWHKMAQETLEIYREVCRSRESE